MVPARTLTRIVLVAGCIALAACNREAATPIPKALPAAYLQAEQTWRAERLASLTKPDGWTSLVGLHWLDPGAHYAGTAGSNGIKLAVGPAQFGMFDVRGDNVRFVPGAGSNLTIDGQPAKWMTLRADDADGGPSVINFDGGKGIATVIHRGDRFALRVKHADAPTRTQFKGITYWPGGPDWIVDATYVPNPPGQTLDIANIVGIIEPTPNPGRVEFKHNGNRYQLEALANDDGGLFLVFADRTSGHGSYGAGRFIDTAPPANGKVRIDFNQAYNPPCAFTPFATCPLPPPMNRLNLAIKAGEKAYGGH
ncbi:DUF1684 domain-containing protein [Cognatilysobacter terrigena]|uniref:DUF1684 domain-containing protein n=1 Tax=Cognatilysobacter terrigena TaxID=2488749 RepID=UPI00105DD150|nr:DUF1684 domain-containing protein [Lysobacter terrigena]